VKMLKMGMLGGGGDAFIGGSHRRAALMDGEISLVAGALASGRAWGLPESRNYGFWQRMLEGELSLPQEDRVDFVSVVVPNHLHFPIAHAFVEAGFNVVLDKPMVHSTEQAERLVEVTGVRPRVCYQRSRSPDLVVRRSRFVRGTDLRLLSSQAAEGGISVIFWFLLLYG
jgi:predicted dehydrogenase